MRPWFVWLLVVGMCHGQLAHRRMRNRLYNLYELDRQLATMHSVTRLWFLAHVNQGGPSPVEDCELETRRALERQHERHTLEKLLGWPLTPLKEPCEFNLQCFYNAAEVKKHHDQLRHLCREHPELWGCDCSDDWWDKRV